MLTHLMTLSISDSLSLSLSLFLTHTVIHERYECLSHGLISNITTRFHNDLRLVLYHFY